ncbi:MAG: transaldolase [Pseudomonadota bacterium]
MQIHLYDLDLPVAQKLRSFAGEQWARRFWNLDVSLFTADPAQQTQIRESFGWLHVTDKMAAEIPKLESFRAELEQGGITDAVLIGMGGSSLCPDLLRLTFPPQGRIRLHVLDSTDPDQISDVESKLDLKRTLFLVASKSGTTIEVDALHEYVFAKVKDPARMAAVTDPGTPLHKLATDRKYRRVFLNPADIGGRYSALSLFGLVPATLLGMDLKKFLRSAIQMSVTCGPTIQERDNVAFILGTFMGEAAERGRNKLTLLLSPEIQAFGAWIEQLAAESTGKEGKGIVPIDDEPSDAKIDASDRIAVAIRLRNGQNRDVDRRLEEFARLRCPAAVIELDDLYDLGGEFLKWEIATAVAGHVMRINPFDQPNVEESKILTKKRLDEFRSSGRLEEPPPLVEDSGISVWGDTGLDRVSTGADAMRAHLRRAVSGDYVAVLAFLPYSAQNTEALGKFRSALAKATGRATTIGFGPRYLHSTGQLHKGGAPNGLFIEITQDSDRTLPIPGKAYDFRTLETAQALGDFEALTTRGRRVVRFHLKKGSRQGLETLLGWVAQG